MRSAQKHEDALTIRQASEADREALTALMLRSEAYSGRYRSMIENYPVTSAMITRGETWIAAISGEIVGFYRLDVCNADLDLLFVDDRAQGAGVGRLIFEHMKSFAAHNGLREFRIVAHPPAAEFYRHMGAMVVGISKAKSADGWDRPILRCLVE